MKEARETCVTLAGDALLLHTDLDNTCAIASWAHKSGLQGYFEGGSKYFLRKAT